MPTYRNIFFNEDSFLIGNGEQEIYYTGKIYENAVKNSNFFQLYDKSKDLVISCNSCAKKNIKIIRKTSEEKQTINKVNKPGVKVNDMKKLPKTKAKIENKVIGKKESLMPVKKKCKYC